METRNHKKFLLRKFFDEYMDLNRSKEDEQVTVDSIRNGVEFKGTNLWILIFATFIASLGLNVNSTAVIIGAMLISPLMGPIMGVGLAIGQNDFELMKVARDRRNLYFYAQTVDPIQLEEADNCMTLWIDVDSNHETGWYGYDYRVNYGSELQLYENGVWRTISDVASETEGNRMFVTIPRSVLQGISADPDIEFKWSDNMQQADPMDWYVNGDAAPGGRFNYIYTTK